MQNYGDMSDMRHYTFGGHQPRLQRTRTPDLMQFVATQGHSAFELLDGKRQLHLRFGDLLPAVPFLQELKLVFLHKLRLKWRDQTSVVMAEYMMAIFKGIFMGVAYLGIGSSNPQLQLGFSYFLVLSVALAGMINMPKLIDEQVVMKMEVSDEMEVSDGLYHEAAWIIAMATINNIVSLGSNSLFTITMFLFSGMSFDTFPHVFLWATLVFITFDALFSFIAAIVKTAQTAQMTALPFLLFVVYHYEQNTGVSVAVYVSLIVALRVGQVVCLKRLNNIVFF